MTHQTTMRPRNAWLALITDYWADPKNVIGPPGAFVRRLLKCMWLILSVYVLFWIAGPSQVASWQLWMENDALAEHIAWGFTFAGALCFAIVGYVAAETHPLKVPLLIPIVEFEEKKYRGWRIKPVHLHLPNIRVTLGALLAAALFAISLLGMWNYYLNEQMRSGGVSVAALSGSTSRVDEAAAALAAGVAAYKLADDQYGQEIARTPANYATARSRLINARSQAANDWRAERARLEAELRAARAATVETHETYSDPRPVDGQVAAATGAPRPLVASLLDLLRSGVVEALLVMGAGLGVAGATSQLGVPREKLAPEPEETVAETPSAPEDEAAPIPPPRRRFTLPPANAEDMAVASVVGPHARAETTDATQEPEPQETHQQPAEAESEPVSHLGAADEAQPVNEPEPIEPESTHQEELDPLMAEHLAAQQAEKENV